MDPCAELTLRLLRATQEAFNPRSSLAQWVLFPHYQRTTWEGAREALVSATKPLMVAPLVESGMIAMWSLHDLTAPEQAAARGEFENQQAYFREKMTAIGVVDEDWVETPDGQFKLSVGDFCRWLLEYSILVGLSMQRSPTANTARVLIRPPGGGGPPIGWIAPPRAS